MAPPSPGPQKTAPPSFLGQLRRAAAAVFDDEPDHPHHGDRKDPQFSGLDLDPAAPITDSARLQTLDRRRQALRWRDHTHAELLRTAYALQDRAIQHIDNRLAQMGLMQKLIAPSADTVLRDWLLAEAVPPIDDWWKRERAKLAGVQPGIVPSGSGDFDLEKSVAWLAQERFQRSNRDLLVQKVREWLLGPTGLAWP
jgi:hypothetical protein